MNLEQSLKAALGINSPEDIGIKSFDDLGHLPEEDDVILIGEEKTFNFDIELMEDSITFINKKY